MKVKKIPNTNMPEGWCNRDLIDNKIYEVIGIEEPMGWYRIIDKSGEDYCYPPELFEIVEE